MKSARKLRLPPDAGLGFDTSSFYFASAFFFAREPALFAGDRLTVGDAPALEAFAWIRAATRTPHFVPRSVDHAQLVSMFRSGALAAMIDGPWVLSDLPDTGDVAVQTLPPFGRRAWQFHARFSLSKRFSSHAPAAAASASIRRSHRVCGALPASAFTSGISCHRFTPVLRR